MIKDSAFPEFNRMRLLVGDKAFAALQEARVVVVGLGGVGSWAAEALVRSGIGHITVIDNDTVDISNINRQIQALQTTLGLPKAAVLMKRLLDINPRCDVSAFNKEFSADTAFLFGIDKADYVIDAIDTMPNKLDLIQQVMELNSLGKNNKPILFSSMGMALRLDPLRIKSADIWNSRACPLARIVRQGLRQRGFKGHFTVVYSDEEPSGVQLTPSNDQANNTVMCNNKKINGSMVTVTAAAGMMLASLVIKDINNG